MFAMILAAGRGERMMPLTENTPKPLLKVRDKCLIDYQIERLSRAGIKDFVVNCGRLGNKIIDHLNAKCEPDHSFYFSDEGDDILETGGGIVNALPLIKSDPFIVVNADVWTNYDYGLLKKTLIKKMHLVLVENPGHNLKGDFGLDKFNNINLLASNYTFSGIGVYSQEVFQNRPVSPFPLVDIIREYSEKNLVTGEIFQGIWSDVGTPERLKKLN